MRFHIPYGVLALLLGGVPAQAQTVITGPVVAQPAAPAAVVQQAETVRTTRTVHTVRRLVPVHERIITTRTVTRRVEPAGPAVVARTVAAPAAPIYDTAVPVAAPAPLYGTGVAVAAPAPLYDTAATVPAPAYSYPAYGYTDYSAPLYDVAPVAPAAATAPPPYVAAPVATAPVIYRYVYEPDRILVIDPTTNIAVQAIPR
jgi:hypothetical protein